MAGTGAAEATGADAAAALLLLSDGRLPAGGHAHSGGLEATVAAGRVHDVASLEGFLRGRAATSGTVAAAFAAAACARVIRGEVADLGTLDAELDARMPSPALRATSRKLGRQLLRAVRVIRPHPCWDEIGTSPHHPLVLGAACAAAGLPPRAAALAAVHDAVVGPATAAVRLLGLDPFATHAALARLGPMLDRIAADADSCAVGDPADLPADSAPLLDLAAEQHATWEVRLFAS
ncbi:urease accessory protein UreF [Geodermatophilus sp. DF01-2]|uniref:urease accessory protein UreF n=1 Tax=Geodermatophilus sp. DF01-2 TaxID=2559610 RepID=UPI001074111C|nr:urease accessory UreF family protein [Geodermatophilus sp. DF01_2]TFV63957.1 urease accessory protein UreF [Geodermatophilus sp. DF01_2]